MRYLVLGATEARDEHGRPVPVGGHRLRALLAALALRADDGAAVPAQVLIEEVWADADTPPADAPAALQALVGRLRRTLGKDAVQSMPGGYRLRARADDVDLLRFQRLAGEGQYALDAGATARAAALLDEALGLWRGPALADLPDRHAAAARAEALRRTAQQHRIAAELALGRAAEVLPELRELAGERPLDEPLQALLIRALRDTGRGAEALEAYETVRRNIAVRLGVDPGAELRGLHAGLLSDTTPPAAGSAGSAGPADPAGDSGTASPAPPHEPARPARPAPPASPAGPAGPGAEPVRGDPAPHRTGTPAGAHGSAHAESSVLPRGNIRTRLTSFVGREADLGTLHADLRGSRLVTLTGTGGSGKTRLAERAAAAAIAYPAHSAYSDGAWLAELASLDHPAAVPGAVLSALGRRETALFSTAIETPRTAGHEPASDALARLLEHCAHRRLLLVLDNCEHVIDAAARLAETLLAHCPQLTVLATSREPLGVPGEVVRPVEPLPPAPAHRLFADRAATALPGFGPGADREAVAEICRRLDGLPLAIELAAARLRSLTPRQIADRLDDRFRLLTSGSRTVLPRQQTLRAVVDWSWDLLDERERTVVRRLSVFSGGCTLSAAEYVCAGPAGPAATEAHGTERAAEEEESRVPEHAVLDILGSLVDKSILIADQPPALADTGVRYRMLETVHEYAKERAAERPADLAAAARRHTDQILRFVTAAEPRLRSAEQLTWLPRVEADLGNVRTALDRTLHDGDSRRAVAVVRAMGWFWWLRNYRDEGARWVHSVLELLNPEPDPGNESERDLVLERELQLLRYFLVSEQHSKADMLSPGHLRLARDVLATFGHPRPEAARFPGLLWPFTAYFLKGPQAVLELMNGAAANCRTHGGAWELAVTLLFRAHLRVDTPGGLALADAELSEIETLAQATGDRWLLSQICGLRAEIATQYGRYDDARADYETAFRYAQQLGAHTEMPFILSRVAEIWYRQGDTGEAEKLAERVMADADRLGTADARTYAAYLRALIALDNGETRRARTLHTQVIEYAAAGTPPAAFDVVIRVLGARITAAEGHRPGEAVREAREALRTGLESGVPGALLANVLLGSAGIALTAGHPRTAVRLADAARELRGDQPPSVPELRDEGRLRAYAEAAGVASPHGRPPLTAEEASALLGTLADTLADAPLEDGRRQGLSGN